MKKLSKKGALWCFRHPHEDIHIITGDSDVTLFDIGSYASRSMYVIGNAVVDAGQKIRQMGLERAAKKLEVAADKLDIKDGRIYVQAAPEKGVSISEILHDAIYDYATTGMVEVEALIELQGEEEIVTKD